MALIGLDPMYGKRIKQFEMVLSKFKEELRCNPDADVTPYTQMLMAQFRKWSKASEKNFIFDLFLDLYEQDAPALRRDFCKFPLWETSCKLRALDTASARFPLRGLLICRLYKTLSPYIYQGALYPYLGEDFSCGLADIGRMRYETDREKYEIDPRKYDIFEIEVILSEFKRTVCRDPDIDVTSFTDDLLGEYYTMENVYIERIIKNLFLNLYAEDVQSLERDITKIKVMPGAASGDRAKLLQTLYWALSSYIGEDFSWIIARCDKG